MVAQDHLAAAEIAALREENARLKSDIGDLKVSNKQLLGACI
jgi:hypothetical protein